MMTDEPPIPAGFVSEPGGVRVHRNMGALKAYCIWSAKQTIERKKLHIRAKRHGVEWLH
jgi:hypothetical protein